uniref:ferredoxin:thioredoxin reductase n=1 Tax=uncultured organism TaxID=155900 RepID=M1PW87_9ZZZZ|nr:ferredoxin-thioredoxin reductase [uncultured organism]
MGYMELISGGNKKHDLKMFAISTCGWCKKTRALLDELDVEYRLYEMDRLEGKEREEAESELKDYNPKMNVPTLVIDDGEKVIVGYEVEEIRELFETGDMAEMLRNVKENAEENGYYVCPDEDLLNTLIEGLVDNKERYGYASCPCRSASGVPKRDVDIICPCGYRVPDIEEYGQCYCGLFVSKEVRENPSKLGSIPERRPDNLIESALEAREKREKSELDKEELETEVRRGLSN